MNDLFGYMTGVTTPEPAPSTETPPSDRPLSDVYQTMRSRDFNESLKPDFMRHANPFGDELTNSTAYKDELNIVRTMISDRENLGGIAPDVVSKANNNFDPQNFKDMATNWRATAFLLNQKVEDLDAGNYEIYQKGVAARLGQPVPKNEADYRNMLAKHFENEAEQDTAYNDLRGMVAKNMLEATNYGKDYPIVKDMGQTLNEWFAKYPNMAGDSSRHWMIARQANAFANGILSDMESVRPAAAKTFDTLLALSQGRAEEGQLESLAQSLTSLDQEGRNKVYRYATIAAESGQVDRAAILTLAKNLGQTFSRGFDFIPARGLQDRETGIDSMLNAIRRGTQIWVPANGDLSQATIGNATPEAMAKAKEEGAWRQATVGETETYISSLQNALKGFQVERELRNVAKNGIDPIKPLSNGGVLGWLETGMGYGFVGSIPLMAAVSINPFVGMAGYQAQEYDRIMFENPNIDRKFAQHLATGEAGVNTIIDMLQLRALAGKSAMFAKTLEKMQSGGVINYFKRTGVLQFEQFAQENMQDLIAPIAESFASALREDMPKKDFMVEIKDYLKSRPEVFFAVLPMALIGGGFIDVNALKTKSNFLIQKQLKIAGMSDNQIKHIFEAKSQEDLNERIQRAWNARTAENIEAGKALGEQEIQQAISSKGYNLSVDEQQGQKTWIVTNQAGEEVFRSGDFDAALEIIGQGQVAAILNENNSRRAVVSWADNILKDPSVSFEDSPTFVTEALQRMEAEGDTKGIENLHRRLIDIGRDPNGDLTGLQIFGETTIEEVKEGVFRASIALHKGYNVDDVFEEIGHGFDRVALAEGRVSMEDFARWLEQTEKASGIPLNRSNDTEILESMARVRADWIRGKMDDAALPLSFLDYLKRLTEVLKEALVRFTKYTQGIKDGTIDQSFEDYMDESIGLPPQRKIESSAGKTFTEVDPEAKNYAIRVTTVAANKLADALNIPSTLGPEFVGRQIIPIEADLTAGGGSFTQKPAQGGPAFSVIPEYFNAGVAWAAAKDGFWTGKLNLARETGAIYKGTDGREKFLVAPYAMKQDSHISNPTVAGEKFSEVSRYIRENRITKEQEKGIAELIQNAAVKGVATAKSNLATARTAVTKAESDLKKSEALVKKVEEKFKKDKTDENEKALKAALKDLKKSEDALKTKKKTASDALAKQTFFQGIGRFPASLTSTSFDTYLASLSFDQRKFLGEKLSSAEAEKLGAPPMDQIRRATLDESFAGTNHLSLISLLEIDVKKLEQGLEKGTLTAKDYGVTPHNSYDSLAPGKPVAFFRTPIPYSMALQDIKNALDKEGYENHGFLLKGRIPNNLPRTQKISAQMITDWADAQTSLRPNQAKAIVTALNQGWKTYTKPAEAGLAEFTRALLNNDAAVTLTQYSAKEVSQMLKEGKMKVYQLGDMNVWFALKRPGKDEAGDPEKDWHIVSVANNEKGAPGMLPLIMAKALAEGGTLLDCFAVKSAKYPDGLLPTLYAKSGFEVTGVLPFDPQYHTEPGKMGEFQKVWDSQKWDGQEMPPLVYMKWNPELHANLGTNARDDEANAKFESHASKDGRSMARGQDSRTGRVAEGSPVSMGGPGQGEQGGRVSDGSSATGSAGNARNILPRGIEQIVADLGNLNDYQLQALGLTKTDVKAAIDVYNNPSSVSYSVREAAKKKTIRSAEEIQKEIDGMSAGELRTALANAKLTPTPKMGAMLGQFPEYLKPVISYMLSKRDQLIEGKVSPRDVAKAYWMTVASIGADAVNVDTIAEKARENGIDFNPPKMFQTTGVNGDPQMRPEELAAYWLGTPDGQLALDNIERGIFNPDDWKSGLILRDAFGRNDLRKKWSASGTATREGKNTITVDGMPVSVTAKKNKSGEIRWSVPINEEGDSQIQLPRGWKEDNRTEKSGGVGIPKGKNTNLQNLFDLTARINEAKGDPAKLEKAVTSAVGIGEGKKGFISHFLGFGEWSTIDAVELNIWLTGIGDTAHGTEEQKLIAGIAKEASGSSATRRDLFDRIRTAIMGLRDKAKGGKQIPKEVAAHIIHHWIWDAAKGIQTTHEGLYHAMRNYSIRDTTEDVTRAKYLSEKLNEMYENGGIDPAIEDHESELEKIYQRLESYAEIQETENEEMSVRDFEWNPQDIMFSVTENFKNGRYYSEDSLAQRIRAAFAGEGIFDPLPGVSDQQLEDAANDLYTQRVNLREKLRSKQPFDEINFSIRTQETIDNIEASLDSMRKSPEGRLAAYQLARERFLDILKENKTTLDEIAATKRNAAPIVEMLEEERASKLADLDIEERAEVESALQDNAVSFAARIESAPFPEDKSQLKRDATDRARILEQGIRAKFAERKIAVEQDISNRKAVAEDQATKNNVFLAEKLRGVKLKQAIGELDGLLRVLPKEVMGRVGGFSTLAKIGQGDKALGDFFAKRVQMVDDQLEMYLKNEYGVQMDKILERSKPKKGKPGEKPKGRGAELQHLFEVLRQAVDFSGDQVSAHLAKLDYELQNSTLTPEQEAEKKMEAGLVTLVGDWKNADASRRATAVEQVREAWAKGYYNFVQREIARREARQMAQQDAISSTGKDGLYKDRQDRKLADNGLGGNFRNAFMNLTSWDQVVQTIFGDNSGIANFLSDSQRKADNAKEDNIQDKMDEVENLFTSLAGGDRFAGQTLRFEMSQPSMKVNGLRLSELEAVTATMMWMQEDGRRHMTGNLDENGNPSSTWHYNQEFIDQIENALSDNARDLRTFLLQKYEDEYQAINRVYRELNGIDLPKIKFYSPLLVKPMQAPQGMVNDPVTGGAVSANGISPGALKSRGTAVAEPEFRDALQTYIAHTKQMEHWKVYAPLITEFNGILRNRDVLNSIEEAGGQEASRVIALWLDLFAQGGNRDALTQISLAKDIGSIAGRAAQIALVGRIGTILVQSTQLGAAIAEMPTGAYLVRLSKLLSGQLSWRDALNSDYIQRRIKEQPIVVQQAMQGLSSDRPNVLKHTQHKIGQLIGGMDGLMTAGTFAIVYDYHLAQATKMGLPQSDAEAYARNVAERATDRLAQPTRMGARSILENLSTNPYAKIGWAFASEGRKNLALAAYAFAKRPKKEALRVAIGLLIANTLFGALIRNAWKDAKDDDDEEFFDDKHWNIKRMILSVLTEPLQGLPLLGESAQEAAYSAAGVYHQNGNLLNVERGIKAIKHLPETVSGTREIEDILKDINGVLSVMGLFNQNLAGAASLSTIAADAFGVATNTKKAVME